MTAHVFEIGDSEIRLTQRAVHLLEGLAGVISSDALRLDIIQEVFDLMHFGEVPTPLLVFLTYSSVLAIAALFEVRHS